jgi:hypothetical protein
MLPACFFCTFKNRVERMADGLSVLLLLPVGAVFWLMAVLADCAQNCTASSAASSSEVCFVVLFHCWFCMLVSAGQRRKFSAALHAVSAAFTSADVQPSTIQCAFQACDT